MLVTCACFSLLGVMLQTTCIDVHDVHRLDNHHLTTPRKSLSQLGLQAKVLSIVVENLINYFDDATTLTAMMMSKSHMGHEKLSLIYRCNVYFL